MATLTVHDVSLFTQELSRHGPPRGRSRAQSLVRGRAGAFLDQALGVKHALVPSCDALLDLLGRVRLAGMRQGTTQQGRACQDGGEECSEVQHLLDCLTTSLVPLVGFDRPCISHLILLPRWPDAFCGNIARSMVTSTVWHLRVSVPAMVSLGYVQITWTKRRRIRGLHLAGSYIVVGTKIYCPAATGNGDGNRDVGGT